MGPPANPRNLLRAIEYLRSYDHDITAYRIATFLFIATRGPIEQQDMRSFFQHSEAAASRNLAELGEGRMGRKGLGWIERYTSARDPRCWTVALTPLGQRILAEYLSIASEP